MSEILQNHPQKTGRKPRRGDLLDVEIDRLDARGRAVGRGYGQFDTASAGSDGDIPFSGPWETIVRFAVPGDRVTAQVLRRRGDRCEARVVEHMRKSPRAVEPRCAHFGTCGGCSFQDLQYEAQLVELRRNVSLALGKLARADGAEIEPVIGCELPWNYRNKMEFTFCNKRWIESDEPEGVDSNFALGLHIPGRFDKVLNVESCSIQDERADAILRSASEIARRLELEPWDPRAHTGLLRHLVLRTAPTTGEIMVNLVTSCDAESEVGDFTAALLKAHPEITTLVQNVNTRSGGTAIGEWERTIFGSGTIREVIGGMTYLISAGSFFQTNSRQAEILFNVVREEAACTRDDRVFDVYCGTGSLSLFLAQDAAEVIGFEYVSSAIADAKRNAEANDITNATFVEGDVIETLNEETCAAPPDVLVVDPPRAGVHPKVVSRLARLGARRIVYVSCNAHSAAKDLEGIVAAGYRVVQVRPIDLFPHTPHVECVITLDARPVAEDSPEGLDSVELRPRGEVDRAEVDT